MQIKTEKVKTPLWVDVCGVMSISLGLLLGYFLNFWVVVALFVATYLYVNFSERAMGQIDFIGLADLRTQAFYVFGSNLIVVSLATAVIYKLYDLGVLGYLKRLSPYTLR